MASQAIEMDYPPMQVTRVETSEALKRLMERMKAEPAAVSRSPELQGVGLCFGGECFVVLPQNFEETQAEAFRTLLLSEETRKIYHDCKAWMVHAMQGGSSVQGFLFDTALGAYVLEPGERALDLQNAVLRYAPGVSAVDEREFADDEVFASLIGSTDAESALASCAYATHQIYRAMSARIEEQGMHQLYYEIELPLCRVLAEMQIFGMKVDEAALRSFGEMLAEKIRQVEQEIYRLAGAEFNIQSPVQLGAVLFETLGLPPVKKSKRGYSTDSDVMEKLKDKHPIVPAVMEYRQYAKLKSTYVDGLTKVISPKDRRIHSSFQQMVTATGRISSADPNLQNIPVRTELGGEIRKMFTPGREGWVYVDADYSQIELRVLAHIAGDRAMQQAFREEADIHTATAAQVFHVPAGAVTGEMRRAAKAVNFGIVYGISSFSLAEDLGVTRYQAQEYIDRYLERYAGVRAYRTEIIEQAKKDGFVTTLCGRRRALPELASKNFNLRSFGERVALNTPIQGTAADIIKIAMIRVSQALRQEGLQARLVLQVHDELLVEAPMEEVEQVTALLKREMEQAYPLSVPLTAEVGTGETWYDAKQ